MSPRNSSAAICHMLRKVSSHRLIVTASSVGSLLGDVKKELAASEYSLDIQELPAFPDIYPCFTRETISDPFEPIALPSRDAFVDGIIPYIHSSGSTGFPKPIPWTHEVLSKFTYAPFVTEYRGLDRDIREFSSVFYFSAAFHLCSDLVTMAPGMPSFHTIGVYFQLMQPLYAGRPSGLFRPTYPYPPTIASPETILQAFKALKPNVALVVPSILETWIHEPEAVQFLKTIDLIVSSPIVSRTCPFEAHNTFSITAVAHSLQPLATNWWRRAVESSPSTAELSSARFVAPHARIRRIGCGWSSTPT
jgi:acyl-CoA synthetase (AMP-forming)/AMP-acid ligase II